MDCVLERNASVTEDLAPPGATPTLDPFLAALPISARLATRSIMRRRVVAASTSTMPAARSRGPILSGLREDALLAARRFITLGIKPGDRVALVAETGAEFATAFFGAVYAGAWPVPLPLPTSFGGREAYVDQLAIQLKSCDPKLLLYPPELSDFCGRQRSRSQSVASGIRSTGRAGLRRPSIRQTRRYRLPPIFERLDAFSAWRRGDPSCAAG